MTRIPTSTKGYYSMPLVYISPETKHHPKVVGRSYTWYLFIVFSGLRKLMGSFDISPVTAISIGI